jgi:hypothetical protein
MCKKGCKLVLLLLPLMLLLSSRASAQEPTPKERHLLFSVYNSGTQLPGSFLSLPLHPGVSAGMEFAYNRSELNRWFQTAKLGLLYHQYSQTALQLYSEGGYRRAIWRGTSAEMRLGAGYLHSFTDVEIFELDPDGTYARVSRFGRPQFMAGAALGLGYTFQKAAHPWRLQLDYQFYLQMPFVNQYVPMLPVTAVHLGCAVPLTAFQRPSASN